MEFPDANEFELRVVNRLKHARTSLLNIRSMPYFQPIHDDVREATRLIESALATLNVSGFPRKRR